MSGCLLMWFDIIKTQSIEEHIDDLIPKIYAQLQRQGHTKITEKVLEEALINFIKEKVFRNKKYVSDFLEE